MIGLPVRMVLLAAAMLAVAAPSSPQQLSEQMDVTVVQVPVVVTRNAKPVAGLRRDDFEVYVNGARQSIAYFDVLQFEPAQQVVAAAVPPPPPDLTQRRLTLVLFDFATSSYLDLQRSRDHVQRLVSQAAANDFIAVATYSGGGSARYLVPFTRDRLAVLRAVATLQRSRAEDALSIAMLSSERSQLAAVGRQVSSTAGAERQFADDLVEGLRDFKKTVESFEAARGGTRAVPSVLDRALRDRAWNEHVLGRSWAQALAEAADELRPLDGIKQVVLISDGSSLSDTRSADFANIAARMHEHFRKAGVVLNVIDAAGLRAPWRADVPHNPPAALFDAALGTGGTVFYGTGVSNSIRLLQDARSVTYLIGIRPPAQERELNDIRVVLKGQPPFTNVSYRRGYARSADGDPSVNGLLLADIMSNDIRRNDVTVQMKIRSIAPATIDVGIPGGELAAHADGDSLELELFVYAFDSANTPAAWKHRRVHIDVAKIEDLKSGHFILREQLDLAPGSYAIKALVHVIGRDRIGFVRREIDIPAARATAGR